MVLKSWFPITDWRSVYFICLASLSCTVAFRYHACSS